MNQYQLYEDFFQEKNSYYIDKLKQDETAKKISFNYAAFLFGAFWLLYRKMYWETILVFLFFYFETYFENTFLARHVGVEQTKLINLIVTILSLATLGVIGNSLYLSKAKRMVKKAEEKYTEYDQKKEYLTKKGGTQFLYIIILIILFVIAAALS